MRVADDVSDSVAFALRRRYRVEENPAFGFARVAGGRKLVGEHAELRIIHYAATSPDADIAHRQQVLSIFFHGFVCVPNTKLTIVFSPPRSCPFLKKRILCRISQ